MVLRIVSLSVAVAFLLAVPDGVPAQPTTDLRQTLVGRWEGELSPDGFREKSTLERTLVISGASQNDGQWNVTARYGVTGGRLEPVAVTVEATGGQVVLKFRTPYRALVTLHLVADRGLVGDFRVYTAGTAHSPMGMRFRKIMPKPTDAAGTVVPNPTHAAGTVMPNPIDVAEGVFGGPICYGATPKEPPRCYIAKALLRDGKLVGEWPARDPGVTMKLAGQVWPAGEVTIEMHTEDAAGTWLAIINLIGTLKDGRIDAVGRFTGGRTTTLNWRRN